MTDADAVLLRRAAAAEATSIGGFAVIANRFVRATEDIDLLVPDDEDNDQRVLAALIGLGYDTVAAEARTADYGGVKFLVAGLRSIVGFKRLSNRARLRRSTASFPKTRSPASIPEQLPRSAPRSAGCGGAL